MSGRPTRFILPLEQSRHHYLERQTIRMPCNRTIGQNGLMTLRWSIYTTSVFTPTILYWYQEVFTGCAIVLGT